MSEPIVYGPGYSTYVRTVRLALEEKGVAYQLQEFDFIQSGVPEEHLKRHPFGKVPAFEHDGFSLYETQAITRYVDEAFSGPALQPGDARGRARMVQIICVADSYTYGPTVGTLVIQRLVTPIMGGMPDENAIKAALPNVEKAMSALNDLVGDNAFLAGANLSLADLHLIPIFAYFSQTPESGPILDKNANLKRWWNAVNDRDSVAQTQPQLG